MTGDPGAGWDRRFVTDPARAADLAALYRSLGFEVVTASPRPADLPEGCETCALARLAFRTLYTRRPSRSGLEGD
jgi:hypothetical protein